MYPCTPQQLYMKLRTEKLITDTEHEELSKLKIKVDVNAALTIQKRHEVLEKLAYFINDAIRRRRQRKSKGEKIKILSKIVPLDAEVRIEGRVIYRGTKEYIIPIFLVEYFDEEFMKLELMKTSSQKFNKNCIS